MSIPAQLISIKIGNKKKTQELKKLEILSEKELIETEKKLLDAKNELVKTKAYYDEFRADAKSEIDRLDQIIENFSSKS
jgi:DNA mismatch repair ATPase MutS